MKKFPLVSLMMVWGLFFFFFSLPVFTQEKSIASLNAAFFSSPYGLSLVDNQSPPLDSPEQEALLQRGLFPISLWEQWTFIPEHTLKLLLEYSWTDLKGNSLEEALHPKTTEEILHSLVNSQESPILNHSLVFFTQEDFRLLLSNFLWFHSAMAGLKTTINNLPNIDNLKKFYQQSDELTQEQFKRTLFFQSGTFFEYLLELASYLKMAYGFSSYPSNLLFQEFAGRGLSERKKISFYTQNQLLSHEQAPVFPKDQKWVSLLNPLARVLLAVYDFPHRLDAFLSQYPRTALVSPHSLTDTLPLKNDANTLKNKHNKE